MTHDFICPLCAADFIRDAKTLRCENGHSFDIAKQGYVNLLPGGRLPGHVHGDNREMVQSRHSFLNDGHYMPLAQTLAELFKEYVCEGGCILDCGCGEGFYSSYIAEALKDRNIDVLATDISRDAVGYAAKRGNIRCAVANTFRLPIKNDSCDAVLSLCAPISGEEFSRVIKQGGYILAVIPDSKHLWSLKKAVYETPYENEPELPALPDFDVVRRYNVKFPVHLVDAQQIRALFTMTPYAYNSNREDQARLMALESLDDEAEFTVFICKKS